MNLLCLVLTSYFIENLSPLSFLKFLCLDMLSRDPRAMHDVFFVFCRTPSIARPRLSCSILLSFRTYGASRGRRKRKIPELKYLYFWVFIRRTSKFYAVWVHAYMYADVCFPQQFWFFFYQSLISVSFAIAVGSIKSWIRCIVLIYLGDYIGAYDTY